MEITFADGSIVVIDGSRIEVVNGGLFIKRVSLNPSGGIDMISDNKIYPVQNIPFEEAVVVGKVVGALERV